ncbi:MAG TPA: glucosidase, partial [Myxococcales bacterium]
NSESAGTKVALYSMLEVPARGQTIVRLRLSEDVGSPADASGPEFDSIFERRIAEADEFYAARISPLLEKEEQRVVRQAYAGLLWSKMFYHYEVKAWLEGDPAQPKPPEKRKLGRNHDWPHLYNRDVLSVPDKWEYPWFAAWDLAFHMVPLATIDPELAKEQLILLLREWYMHPNGQIPAYEFDLSDANPPVHAWAVWRVYKIAANKGKRDRRFLIRAFEKLLLNFTWWVNRKDAAGRHLFAGGFLGLDNIGVFDRSKLQPGFELDQADGTAWMGFYCATMLAIALELAREDVAYDDIASKFFEHFVAIADAINSLGGMGLWDEEDGFYYDLLRVDGAAIPLRLRSAVGLIPLLAVEPLEGRVVDRLPGFKKRMKWFLENRRDLTRDITYLLPGQSPTHGEHLLLALPSRERLQRLLRYALDEKEFYSPYGVRSLSKIHQTMPYNQRIGAEQRQVAYEPGESSSGLFGGNSNWRGPVWFPLNYLLIEALERYHHFYRDSFQVECPTGSGKWMSLLEVARDLSGRLAKLFLPDSSGLRPCFGSDARLSRDPHWRDMLWFHEYFHGDSGRGLGASHQTGWTALVVRCIEEAARERVRHRPHSG